MLVSLIEPQIDTKWTKQQTNALLQTPKVLMPSLFVSFSSGVNQNEGINQNDITDINKQRIQTDSALENISEWRQFAGEDMFRSKEPSLWKPFLLIKKFTVYLLTPIIWYSILTVPFSWDSRSELMIFENSRMWETSPTKPKVRNFPLKHWNSTPIQQGYGIIFLNFFIDFKSPKIWLFSNE